MEFTQEFFERINSYDSQEAGFRAIAAETGYSIYTIKNNYRDYRKKNGISKAKEMLEKDRQILLAIAENPDNLQQAFKTLSIKLNVETRSLANRYYKYLKNNPNNPVFTIVGNKSGHVNVKNNINNKYPRYKTNHSFIERVWGKIKYFVNNLKK